MDYFKTYKSNKDVDNWYMNRPRMGTLVDALNHDKKTINQLLNRGDEEAKAAIARIVDCVMFEYAHSNQVNREFENFMREYYGDEKFDECLKAWLTSVGNDFFQRAGMPQEQKPISKIIMFPKDDQ